MAMTSHDDNAHYDLYRSVLMAPNVYEPWTLALPSGTTEDHSRHGFGQLQSRRDQASFDYLGHANVNNVTEGASSRYECITIPSDVSLSTAIASSTNGSTTVNGSSTQLCKQKSSGQYHTAVNGSSLAVTDCHPVQPSTRCSISLLLPTEFMHHKLPDQAAHLWDEQLHAPSFLIAEHKERDGASSTSNNVGKPSTGLKPITEWQFISEYSDDNVSPEQRQRTVKQTAMHSFVVKHGGDPRKKRSREGPSRARSSDAPSSQGGTKRPCPGKRTSPEHTSTTVNHATQAQAQRSNGNVSRHVYDSYAVQSHTAVSGRDSYSHNLDASQPRQGIVCYTAPNVVYSPVYTAGNKTFYVAQPLKGTRLLRNSLDSGHNQFKEWPAFPTPDGEVERLKYYCVHRFGSPGVSRYWVPVLRQSGDAFYSTICMSVVHDEIMEKEFDLMNVRPLTIARRTQVRDDIITMIKESIVHRNDTSDGIVMAVLHIWYSELLRGDSKRVRIHRQGLIALVHARGGLTGLGVEGQLARTLVIMMFLAACIDETMPDKMYMLHARHINTEPPQTVRPLLDSPVYAGSRFCSMSQAGCNDSAFGILELTRQATSAFFTLHGMRDSGYSRRLGNVSEELKSCHAALLSIPSIRGRQTKDSGFREMVRLCCCIFVHALVREVPISQAVKDFTMELYDDSSTAVRQQPVPMLIRLKEALKQSSFDECWGEKSSVLLWCGLVALASVGDSPTEDQAHWKAREFIAAVTLRTAILQVFSRPVAMLGMLRRFVAIQRVLTCESRRDAEGQKTHRYGSQSSNGTAGAYKVNIRDAFPEDSLIV